VKVRSHAAMRADLVIKTVIRVSPEQFSTSVGRPVAMPALVNNASLDRLISLASVRAKAPAR
jgi:hypothetical protein